MSKYARTTYGGYSLVEMLVYVAMVTFGAVLIVSTLIGFGKAYLNYKTSQEVHRSASFALERLLRETKAAKSVALGSSTLGTNPSVLVLNTEDASGFDTTVSFSVMNDRLMIQEGSGAWTPLTSGGVTVPEFVVWHVSSTSEAVQFTLSLERTRGVVTKSAVFQSGAVLRGSYLEE